MIRRLAPLAALVWAVLAAPTVGQTVIFTLTDSAPPGTVVQVLDAPTDITPEAIPFGGTGFEYKVKIDPAKWRNEPSFLISLPKRDPTTDPFGVDDDPVNLRLDFSFTADWIGGDIIVPIEVVQGTGVRERNRIDRLPSYSAFQKILGAQALTSHYLARLQSKQDSATRYMTKVWFETLYGAIAHGDLPLRISDDFQAVIDEVFSNDPDALSHFAGARAQLRWAIWSDPDHFPDLVSGGKCASAKDMIKGLKANLKDHPDDSVEARLADAADVVADMESDLNQCRPST